MAIVRAVRTTTTVKRIDPTKTPKEIDLTTDLPAGTIALNVEGETYKPTGKINKGIYELSGDNLRYCFAAPGKLRPKKFEVAKGSGHTLVVLKRFKTGEADTIAALKQLGADVTLDDGWASRITLRKGAIPPDALLLLKKFTKLKSASFDDTNITDAGLAHLGDVPPLETISLKGTQVTNVGLAHLKKLINLRGLWLTNTEITDAGLVHLTGHQHLYNLWLDGTNVTDAGIAVLSNMQSLEWLILDNTRVTEEGKQQLSGLKKLTKTSTKKPSTKTKQ